MTGSRSTGPRGEARRAVIVEAAARILRREGLAGLAHRAVAAEAGVPLGSTTYYFSGRDELARAAVASVLAAERARRAALPAARPDGPPATAAAERLLDLLVPPDLLAVGSTAVAAFYQRWTEAARDRALAALLEEDLADLRERVAALLATGGLAVPVDTALALGDGRLLHALADGATREELVRRLSSDLAAFAGTAPS